MIIILKNHANEMCSANTGPSSLTNMNYVLFTPWIEYSSWQCFLKLLSCYQNVKSDVNKIFIIFFIVKIYFTGKEVHGQIWFSF